ncbi:MAG: hypothetical protein IJP53_01855 [Synergistaceae bacterium]|nr:hypothetical protein [Synergistaceae bacterium]
MKEKILKLLSETMPNINFTASNSLVDDGILDSLAIVGVVNELSLEFDVTFDIDQLTPQNFNSLDAMAATVEQLLKEKR